MLVLSLTVAVGRPRSYLKLNLLWPKMALLGASFLGPNAPDKGLCESLVCIMTLSAGPMGALGGGGPRV